MGLPARIITTAPFPESAAEAELRAWYAEFEADMTLIVDVPPTDETSVLSLAPLISSQHALECVMRVEKLVGYKISDAVVKRGGYTTCDELVKHLVPRMKANHEKR
jgi:hypothetical protein